MQNPSTVETRGFPGKRPVKEKTVKKIARLTLLLDKARLIAREVEREAIGADNLQVFGEAGMVVRTLEDPLFYLSLAHEAAMTSRKGA